MKGKLGGWIEIFRTGRHTDGSGQTRDFSRADLDKTVGMYDPDEHEAPAVIGHPQDNGPAYGWVEKIQRAGDVLLAKFKQIEPAFAEMATAGRFKKRSISLYPDGSLRHVGFLGAQPPAIKGLKDFAFSGDDCPVYEFSEHREHEEVGMTEVVEKLQAKLATEKARADKAEDQAREFKEKAEQVTVDFAEARAKRKRAEITNFVDQSIKDGKMLPTWKEDGLVEFMAGLEDGEQTFQFAEGRKETAAQWFKTFISSFAEHPLFKEMAKPETEADSDNAEFAEAEAIAKEIAASTL